MINLLPSQEKQKILLAQRNKLIIILWIFILFFIFCFIFILFFLSFNIQDRTRYQKIVLEQVKEELEKSEIKDLQDEINSANSTLRELSSFYQKRIYLTEVIEDISDIMPPEMYLNDFSATFFEGDKEFGFKVVLSGFISTREILFDFKNNIEKKEKFEEVYFPPSNWIKSSDIDFFTSFNIVELSS